MRARIWAVTAVCLAIIGVAAFGFFRGPAVRSAVYGDVNCDNRVNAVDALLLLQYDAGRIRTLSCRQNADANADGRINALDAALVLQLDARIIGSIRPTPISPPMTRPVSRPMSR